MNNERLSNANTICDQILANYSRYFTALQDINNLETQRQFKTKVNLKNLKSKEKSIKQFSNYSLTTK